MNMRKYVLKKGPNDSTGAQDMKGIENEGEIRTYILKKAKEFKSSWIEFARVLYPVWKDKLYRGWGYLTFEGYTAKEIKIRRTTAMKLLGSYSFMEKEEPQYLTKEYIEGDDSGVPQYEAVEALRKAKTKGILDEDEYAKLKTNVFESGYDAKEVKKELTSLIKQREEVSPDEARKRENIRQVQRLLTSLKTIKRDLELLKILPASITEETASLIQKIEQEMDKKDE